MKQKFHFKKLSLFWGILLILGISVSIATLDIALSYRDFNAHSKNLRSDFINNQKEIIKEEVTRVAELISHETAQTNALTKQIIKLRVYEAWNIAQNIYLQNQKTQNKSKILEMIKDALRPIRFEKGTGYFFMTALDGTELLFADKPEFEGKNLLETQDTQGKYVIRDMIGIAKKDGEGFYHYHWTKPGSLQNDFEKISFIKYIESMNCFVGAGLYVDAIEANIKERLLATISRIRFGKEGYIFINRLNGDALVSNGRLIQGKKKLWEVFSKNPEKVKQLFDKEYKAALTAEGDYIYYTLPKLSSAAAESPKTSFILGLPDLQWLIGAGVYLDDVDDEIAIMQKHLQEQTLTKLFSFTLLTVLVVLFFLLLFRKFNINMMEDIDRITTFFNNETAADKSINREQLKFHEFDKMAQDINTIFVEKSLAQKNLYDKKIALLESEERFRNTMDSTLIGVYIIQDFVFQYVNPAITSMFGYTEEEMLKKMSPLDLVVPEQREQVKQNLKRRESGELKRITDIKCLRSNGEVFDAMVLGAATIHEGKTASVGTMIDITERKTAEDELKRSETRATALLEAIPDMVFRLNGDGVYLDVKADSKDLYQPSLKDIIGKTSDQLLPAELAQLIREQIRNTINSEETHTIEYQLEIPGLGAQDFEGRMVKSGENEVTSIVRNITGRKKAAKEKNALENQLNQAKRMESIGLMAGGVAHDLNNILSGVVGHPDLILRKIPKDSGIRNQIKAIRDSGMRAAAVVDDLLTVARGAASTRENHNLTTLIREYLNSPECTKLKSLHPKVLIFHELNAAESRFSCSQVHIKKCIMNLVTNAVEAITGAGMVTLATYKKFIDEQSAIKKGVQAGEYHVLSVHDNGPGISAQDIDHIFEPFYSKKNMARSGTGLGLTVVWNTVQDHKGQIFVDSDARGTTFELYFPSPELLDDTPTTNKEMQDTEAPHCKGEHILVVDDEPLLRDIAYEMLLSFGYTVDCVSSGEDAIQFVKSTKVDLLLIDMQMEPGINGYQTYKKISALYPGQKAIIASGYSENKDIKACLELGAQDFIKKPYTLDQLIQTVQKTLQN